MSTTLAPTLAVPSAAPVQDVVMSAAANHSTPNTSTSITTAPSTTVAQPPARPPTWSTVDSLLMVEAITSHHTSRSTAPSTPTPIPTTTPPAISAWLQSLEMIIDWSAIARHVVTRHPPFPPAAAALITNVACQAQFIQLLASDSRLLTQLSDTTQPRPDIHSVVTSLSHSLRQQRIQELEQQCQQYRQKKRRIEEEAQQIALVTPASLTAVPAVPATSISTSTSTPAPAASTPIPQVKLEPGLASTATATPTPSTSTSTPAPTATPKETDTHTLDLSVDTTPAPTRSRSSITSTPLQQASAVHDARIAASGTVADSPSNISHLSLDTHMTDVATTSTPTQPSLAHSQSYTSTTETQPPSTPNTASSDMEKMITVWTKLNEMPDSEAFREPVNMDEAPGYADIIKQPMDLSTIRSKMDNGTITSPEAMFGLVMLVCSNCFKYNERKSVYWKAGKTLESQTITLFKQTWPSKAAEWVTAAEWEKRRSRKSDSLQRIKSSPLSTPMGSPTGIYPTSASPMPTPATPSTVPDSEDDTSMMDEESPRGTKNKKQKKTGASPALAATPSTPGSRNNQRKKSTAGVPELDLVAASPGTKDKKKASSTKARK